MTFVGVSWKKNGGQMWPWMYVTQLHYPNALATKAALADDVAEVRFFPAFQWTGAIQTRQTSFGYC